MNVTVELSEEEIRSVCDLTGIQKKGPAIRKLIADSIMMRKRAEIADKFVSGEWSADFQNYEDSKETDQKSSLTLSEAWRD